jgi:hypothetical protein
MRVLVWATVEKDRRKLVQTEKLSYMVTELVRKEQR